jgi:hypothetical protein
MSFSEWLREKYKDEVPENLDLLKERQEYGAWLKEQGKKEGSE